MSGGNRGGVSWKWRVLWRPRVEGASHGVLVGSDGGVVSGLGGGQVAITTIREIKALRRLGTHENVVSLIELYTPTGECQAGLWW